MDLFENISVIHRDRFPNKMSIDFEGLEIREHEKITQKNQRAYTITKNIWELRPTTNLFFNLMVQTERRDITTIENLGTAKLDHFTPSEVRPKNKVYQGPYYEVMGFWTDVDIRLENVTIQESDTAKNEEFLLDWCASSMILNEYFMEVKNVTVRDLT